MLRLTRRTALFVSLAAPACSPGGGGDTGETTAEETGEPTGGGAGGCERLTGGDTAWYLRCGGAISEGVQGVAIGADGSVFVGFELTNYDGVDAPFTIGEFEVTPGEYYDFVIAKFDSEGEPLWVKQFGGPGSQSLYKLRGCGGGVALAGNAEPGTVDFGGGPVDGDFLVSLDGDGGHRWTRSFTNGDDSLAIGDLACDESASLVITGQVSGAVDLGDGPLELGGLYDGMVARYGATGDLLWVRTFGGVGGVGGPYGRAVTFGPGGEVAVAGSFDGTLDLGGGPLTADDGDDVLAALLSPTGDHLWSANFGPYGLQYGSSVAVSANGLVAIGGVYLNAIELGDASYTNSFPDAQEPVDGTLYDGFIAWLDAAGAATSSVQVGSMRQDDIYDLQFAPDGALIMSGYTEEAYTLRAYVGGTAGWSWTAPAFELRPTVMAAVDGAVIVASSPEEVVDFGAGPLASHGGNDVVVAKILR
jgi:hypothetical protein